jgi:chaperonin GroES
MKPKLKPLGNRVMVEPIEEQEVTPSGIVIPETAKEEPNEGVVVALGTGKLDEQGKIIPFEVKSGDKVLLSKYGGTDVELGDKRYKILDADEILAVVE